MKVTWNDFVLEGTPQEIQAFLSLCNGLPVVTSDPEPSREIPSTRWNQWLHYEYARKSYGGRRFTNR